MSNTLTATEPAPQLHRARHPRSYVAQVVIDTFGENSALFGLIWIGILAFCAVFGPVLATSHPFVLKVDGKWSSPWLANLQAVDVILLVSFFNGLVLASIRKLEFRQKAGIFCWLVAVLFPMIYWPMVVYSWSDWVDHDAPWKAWTAVCFAGVVDLAAIVLFAVITPLSWKVRTLCLIAAVGYGIFFVKVPVRPPLIVVYEQYRELNRQKKIEFAIYAPIPYSPSDRLRDFSNPGKLPPTPFVWLFGNKDSSPVATQTIHWMGTDQDGGDVLSQMVNATRVAMSIGFISTGIALIIGITLGGLMGYYAGWIDLLGMRLVDIFSAIPTLPLLLTIIAFYGRNFYMIMVVLGLLGWVGYAINTRAEFLKLRKQDFVQAAIAMGLPLRSILFRHLLPNGVTPVLVIASFGIASAIFTESTLSFLGLGPIDSASWGEILNQAVNGSGGFAWWLAIFPGLAIFLTVLSYNLIGESLRDAIDPHLKKSSSL